MTDVRPNRRQVLTSAGALGALAALVSPIVACAQQANGQQPKGNAEGLEGAWLVTVTPEGSGAPPPLPVLIMFAAGGGLVDFARPPSPGFGAWVRTGEDTFALTFLVLLFDPHGKFAGTTKIRAQAKLSQDGATYTGPGINETFDPTGKLVATFKSHAHATRITVEPV